MHEKNGINVDWFMLGKLLGARSALRAEIIRNWLANHGKVDSSGARTGDRNLVFENENARVTNSIALGMFRNLSNSTAASRGSFPCFFENPSFAALGCTLVVSFPAGPSRRFRDQVRATCLFLATASPVSAAGAHNGKLMKNYTLARFPKPKGAFHQRRKGGDPACRG